MKDQTVLITGGTGGIGFHIAAALAEAGAQVFVTGRDRQRGAAAVSELRQLLMRWSNLPQRLLDIDLQDRVWELRKRLVQEAS